MCCSVVRISLLNIDTPLLLILLGHSVAEADSVARLVVRAAHHALNSIHIIINAPQQVRYAKVEPLGLGYLAILNEQGFNGLVY
jgi:hypothetical protein